MTSTAFRRTASLFGALVISTAMIGATLDAASARTVDHRSTARSTMHDSSMDALMQDVRQTGAADAYAASNGASRVQIPNFNGGLTWVPEDDYRGANSDD